MNAVIIIADAGFWLSVVAVLLSAAAFLLSLHRHLWARRERRRALEMFAAGRPSEAP